MKVAAEIDIQAPIEKVFSVFSDLNHTADRIQGIKSVEILSGPAQMAIGTKWKETRVMFGKEATETMWVTELTSPQKYVVEAKSHNMKYRSTYNFTPAADGTQVAMTFEGTPQTMGAKIINTIFSFMAGSTKKMLLQDMQDLKEVCEAK